MHFMHLLCTAEACFVMQTPRRAYTVELTAFHDQNYIEYLSTVNVENQHSRDYNYDTKYQQYGMGDDCPVFDGMYDFCQLYAGASIQGATRLNHNLCDVAINWSGGLHHAKKASASGQFHPSPAPILTEAVLGLLFNGGRSDVRLASC